MQYLAYFLIFFTFALPSTHASWLKINDLKIRLESTDLGGTKLVIEYHLAEESVSVASPAYVFLRYRTQDAKHWERVPFEALRGSGFGLVEKPGPKQIVWWGTGTDGLCRRSRCRDPCPWPAHGPRACRRVCHEELAGRWTG